MPTLILSKKMTQVLRASATPKGHDYAECLTQNKALEDAGYVEFKLINGQARVFITAAGSEVLRGLTEQR